MKYLAIAETDVGISKNVNQDSLLIKHASADGVEILMAVICDGMGGLSSGELASATVIREFGKWFDNELCDELDRFDLKIIAEKWVLMLKDINSRLLAYGAERNENLGTTFSGVLFYGNSYVIVHVGDCRIYQIGSNISRLTVDHTYIAREISLGNITPEQAKTDKRRNMLLQCVGASKVIEPQILLGRTETGTYLMCSDGFRHEISEETIRDNLCIGRSRDKNIMHNNVRYLIEEVKRRKEKDNISAILIKAE